MYRTRTHKAHHTKGYTLPELVFYIGVFTFIAVVSVNSIIIMSSAFLKVRTERSVTTVGTGLLERIVFEVQDAQRIDGTASVFGTSPGELTVVKDGGGTTRMYEAGGQVKIDLDGVLQGNLTPETIAVDNLTFHYITDGNIEAVRTVLTLHDVREKEPNPRTFYATIIPRDN